MRTVEASRRIDALAGTVLERLSPAAIIEHEGTFAVEAVEETEDGWTVFASAPGMAVSFAFEAREDGYGYRAVDEVGPFETLETELSVRPSGTGAEVTMRSSVSLRLPLPFADRVAAWKRRGELRRALASLAADVGELEAEDAG